MHLLHIACLSAVEAYLGSSAGQMHKAQRNGRCDVRGRSRAAFGSCCFWTRTQSGTEKTSGAHSWRRLARTDILNPLLIHLGDTRDSQLNHRLRTADRQEVRKTP